jgi:hypothetical protein
VCRRGRSVGVIQEAELDALIDQNVNRLAEAEHDRWMEKRLALG